MDTVKFGLFSDLHLDIMHDGERRLKDFLEACDKENVDFIMNNGDFCYPKDSEKCVCSCENLPVNLHNAMVHPTKIPKLELLNLFNTYKKPHYHVLGNHELDFCSKEEVVSLYGMPSAYYDFFQGGWHFIVLDPNHFKDNDGNIQDYRYGNYFDYQDLPYVDERQLQWLHKVLKEHSEPAVIFSHQPLFHIARGIKNYEELQEIWTDSLCGRVKLCIYGHVHLDEMHLEGDILHYSINSISNHWIGPHYACHRYHDDIEEEFPNLQYVFPYAVPVYAFVTLDEQGLKIKGKNGRFVSPAPRKIGFCEYPVTASVRDRYVQWKKENQDRVQDLSVCAQD